MGEHKLFLTYLQTTTVFPLPKGSFPPGWLLQAGAEMDVTSTALLPVPITSFIFPNGSPRSITCFLWGTVPSLPAQVSSDFAYAESQVTLAQPADEYSSSLLSCAVDTKC